MSKEVEFSAGAKKRFEEIAPENYKKELRRLARKVSEAQFLYGLVIFLGSITPLFAIAMSGISGSFAIIWAFTMAYSVVKAFRRIENPITHMEVRHLILQAQHRDLLQRTSKTSKNETQSAEDAEGRGTDE